MSSIGSLASTFSSMSQARVADQVGMAVMKKSLDAGKAQGEAAISLLEDAAQLSSDIIRADPHKGNMIDVTA